MKQNILLYEHAGQAAHFLRTLSNEHRLAVLCILLQEGEMSVSDLLTQIPLSQSALSQHLAKMRDMGMITYRRDAQVLYYRISNENVIKIVLLLSEMFHC